MALLRRRSLFPTVAALVLPKVALAQPLPTWRAGLQLYTVRDLLRADMDRALRSVADIGYREVELAGADGTTIQAIREKLKACKLDAPSMHIGYDSIRGDLEPALDGALQLGAAFVVCPWIDSSERRTADEWRKVCRALDAAARAARRRGLTLAYHNHDFEFLRFEGGPTPFDLLLQETDPRDLKLELDVYWAAKAGMDPVKCLTDNAGRVVLVHLKDMAADGSITELGAGVLPMEQIIRSALAAGVKHLFVEQDDPPDPLRSIGASLRFLERLPPGVRPLAI